MNRLEEELLGHVKNIFNNELNNNTVELEISTPENAKKYGYTYKGWAVGITKIKMTNNMKDVRVVIWSPDPELLNEVDDYQIILKRMAELSKHIIDNPPFLQYVSQGVIRTTYEGDYVEFIPKDKLREMH